MKLSRILLLIVLFGAATRSSVAAQTMQGLIHEEDPANNRDLYRLRVRQQVTMLLGQWKRAWDRHAGAEGAELYTRDGVFVTSGGQEVSGRDSLRSFLDQVFSTAGPLRFALIDFDFSGELAFVRGQMAYSEHAAAGAAETPRVQTFTLIARRQRADAWLIRSLALAPAVDPEPAAAGAATATPAAPPSP